MLLIRDSTLKRAFPDSSCWALAPVLNEFIVSTALGDIDYSSNVGMATEILQPGGVSAGPWAPLTLRRFSGPILFLGE